MQHGVCIMFTCFLNLIRARAQGASCYCKKCFDRSHKGSFKFTRKMDNVLVMDQVRGHVTIYSNTRQHRIFYSLDSSLSDIERNMSHSKSRSHRSVIDFMLTILTTCRRMAHGDKEIENNETGYLKHDAFPSH